MRYSKGGVNLREALSMDGRRLVELEQALSSLVNEEVEAAKGGSKGSGSRGDEEE